jgi:hypothetical protein
MEKDSSNIAIKNKFFIQVVLVHVNVKYIDKEVKFTLLNVMSGL